MTKPARKKHGLRGNHFLPIAAGFLAFVALCGAILLFVSQPETGGLFGYAGGRAKLPSSVPARQAATVSNAASEAASEVSTVSYSTERVENKEWFSDAVFIGDSTTGGLAEYHVLNENQVLYANGMNTASAAKTKVKAESGTARLTEVLADRSPKKIFILLGLNDLDFTPDTDPFIAHYGELISKIKNICPDAALYIESILPVTAKYSNAHPDGSNARVDAFNKALKAYCDGNHLEYRDVGAVLRGPDGALPSSVSTDGFNIKAKYYTAVLNYLYDNR